MVPLPRTYLKNRYYLISFLAVAAILLVDYLGFIEGVNNYCYDTFFRLRGNRRPSPEILVIVVDDQCLELLKSRPVSRKNYAVLLDKLKMAGLVGFDLIFSEPTPDDPVFLDAIQRHGKTYFATYVNTYHDIAKPAFPVSEEVLGHAHLDPGVDGVARDVFHTIMVNRKALQSFASLIYSRIHNQKTDYPMTGHHLNTESGPWKFGQKNRMGINYYGGSGTFHQISMADVIFGNSRPETFYKDKIVLVGITATGLADTILNPFSENGRGMSGVEVHANIVNNLMDGSHIRKFDDLTWSLIVIAFSFIVILLTGLVIHKRLLFLYFFSFALLPIAFFLSFVKFFIWLPPMIFMFILSAVFVCAYISKLENMGHLLGQADEDWHDSFNSIQDGIVINDAQGRTLLINQAAKQFGRLIIEDILTERTQHILKEKKIQDVRLVSDEINDRYLELRFFRRYAIDGSCSGVVHVLRDVTEKKHMEENQSKLQNQLTQAQKMEAIGTLSGGIAHDFNNILSPIIGFTHLVMASLSKDSEAHRMLTQVNNASLRAKELVKQILSFSRKSDEQQKPQYIHPIINEAIKLLRSSIPVSIEIKTTLDINCGPVMCNSTQIHQVFMNLCTNAYHAMIESGGILTITMENISIQNGPVEMDKRLSGEKYIRIIISDTGHGMDKTTIDRIFDPYFTTKPHGEGTGLGLSVVHGIVENHNGRIDVSSEEGTGTTFTVYLPEIPMQHEASGTGRRDLLTPGTERIMVVDDEEPIAEMQTRILESLGYRVTTFTDGLEALKRFCDGPDQFDLVITDQTMPMISGSELAKKMLEMKPDIPIILCTGYSPLITKEKSRAMGISHFLMKPVAVDELSRCIRSILDGRN
jgi:signal transduction histidine kinase/ActR/RegA family two-component response regulator